MEELFYSIHNSKKRTISLFYNIHPIRVNIWFTGWKHILLDINMSKVAPCLSLYTFSYPLKFDAMCMNYILENENREHKERRITTSHIIGN